MNGKRYGRGLIAAFSALVAVVAIILAVFVISGDEADLSYRSVDFDARLQSNGDIRFTEHLDYQLKRREDGNGDTKPWKQLYLTFKLRNQDLTNITDISVTNASTGEEYTQTDPQLPSGISDGTWDSTYAGHWYIADTTAGSDSPQPFDPTTDGIDPNGSGEQKNIEIGWNIPATVNQSSLKFDVSMTFRNMATQHSDVTNLMWEMFPENNQVPAGKVTGTVRFPKGIASNNSWAWLHTEATSQTSRDADGTLHFTISDLRTNQYVDLVAAFDNTGAAGVERTQSGDYLDELKSTEAAKERQWRDRQRLKAQLTVAGWLICLIIGVLCCVLGVGCVGQVNVGLADGTDTGVDDADADLIVGDLLEALLNGLGRALHVSLNDDGQLLHIVLSHLAEQVIQSDLLEGGELLLLGGSDALLGQLTGQTLVLDGLEQVAGLRWRRKRPLPPRSRCVCTASSMTPSTTSPTL